MVLPVSLSIAWGPTMLTFTQQQMSDLLKSESARQALGLFLDKQALATFAMESHPLSILSGEGWLGGRNLTNSSGCANVMHSMSDQFESSRCSSGPLR